MKKYACTESKDHLRFPLFQHSSLTLSLPQNVHLLTLEPWKANSILIRFEHILEKNEDPKYSKSVTFNFKDVFRSFDVEQIQETTLSANQWLNDAVRFKFRADKNQDDKQNEIGHEVKGENKPNPEISPRHDRHRTHKKSETLLNDDHDPFTITLKPMEIRTFVVTLEWRP